MKKLVLAILAVIGLMGGMLAMSMEVNATTLDDFEADCVKETGKKPTLVAGTSKYNCNNMRQDTCSKYSGSFRSSSQGAFCQIIYAEEDIDDTALPGGSSGGGGSSGSGSSTGGSGTGGGSTGESGANGGDASGGGASGGGATITNNNGACGQNEINTSLFGCVKSDDGDGIFMVLNVILNVLTFGIGIAGTLGIVIAGVMYLTARDNESQVVKAKNMLINIVIGLVAYAVLWAFLQWLIPGGVFG